ncbi:MAG: hypothetical protein QOI06_1553 [Nocardioidaceae bacterium]|jgi:uncharacterized protein (TIGR03083 family)|nr:hypothetical protein [Nocardioidaceae bacterium]
MTTTRLEPQEYFESIDADTERLLTMAGRGLEAEVPRCPGWKVADVVSHVAQVYEHKVRVMADNGWPSPWPPADLVEQAPVSALVDAKSHLFAEFAAHDPGEQTTTFSADDSTIGFWVRRMALEVAIHRHDGETAHDDVTPIPQDLAVDGIDEVLRVMLAGPWWAGRVTTEHPLDAAVAVESGGRRWLSSVSSKSATVAEDESSPAAATISGDPQSVFLWLWGRVGDDRVETSGDPDVAREFRARLAECTG